MSGAGSASAPATAGDECPRGVRSTPNVSAQATTPTLQTAPAMWAEAKGGSGADGCSL